MAISIDKPTTPITTQAEVTDAETVGSPSGEQQTNAVTTTPDLPPAAHLPKRVIQNETGQESAKPLDLQAQRNAAIKPLDPAFVGLEPASMWRHFNDITRIPHGSGNEAALRDHIKSWALGLGFQAETDEVGNLLVRVNPNARGPVIGLQNHLDMVCVADDDVTVDFKKDAIPVKRDGDAITAEGTSLGADNGIGVAYAMALAETCKRPLELLFTIDEEDGFTGIDGLREGWLKSSKVLNLDSEEEGYFTVACAGGRDFIVDVPLEREAAGADLVALHLGIDGLKGGHSGVEIQRDRTNALKAMGRLLEVVEELGGSLYGLRGGSKRNVIPFSSHAKVGLPADKIPELEARLAELRSELATAEDPDIELELERTTDDRDPVTGDGFGRVLALLNDLPTGVIKSTPGDAEQPYVSNNLAVIEETDDGGLRINNMARSPSQAELDAVEQRIAEVASGHGAASRADGGYLGWEADYDSPLLASCLAEFKEIYGKEAKVLEIHAGLECGTLKAKYPQIDVISFGPDIQGAHTTNERAAIGSAARTFDLLRAVVAELHG